MKIAQIAPIVDRVPPEKYGGTERVIYTLTEELVKRGHEVTLFATGDSITSAKLFSVTPKGLKELGVEDMYGFNLQSMTNMGQAYAMQANFDIIHDHNPHMGLPTANLCQTPVVTTWHGPYSEEIKKYFTIFSKPYRVSISNYQAELAAPLTFAGRVYNGLYLEHYPFLSNPLDGYMLFVGRIDAEKSPHLAIEVAAALKKKLIIAAKVDDMIPHIRNYHEKEVLPRLKKHARYVEWVGEVNEQERNELMSRADCLLHPIQWPEPFGLALIEAMACGCPVVAFKHGSIPEIIVDRKTGYIVTSLQEMIEAVKKIGKINRVECRRHALENFNAKKMAEGYEAIYQKILNKEI